ncbi:hypothetical protein GUJ93_ZPchr0001g32115 [Zizania palustris]|uniref:SPX domain-containing protein n=1 Tax=Zizania palustris TaxID=103762 RepID=A0A8J5S272_ZIZPA|nr:hypothetical protein GUJ93_ZPchr0001g32115 [Zizania palustris]
MDILLHLKVPAARAHRRAAAEDDDPSLSASSSSAAAAEDESARCVTSATDTDELTQQEADEQPATISELGLECSGRFQQQRKNLNMNIPLTTTPSRAISALTDQLVWVWDDAGTGGGSQQQLKKRGGDSDHHAAAAAGIGVGVNKTKLRHAEKMIKGAFVELYKGLGYLATYRNLNMMAFVKILKRFDKVTGKQAMSIYLKVVETSYFNSSDEALKLMDEVEDMFVKHFAGDNKRKAMKYLKPTQRKESHTVTFFTGLLTGCFVVLFMGYCIMAHIAGIYTQRRDSIYMETVYPALSMFSLLFLHLFLYGCNMVAWRKARINYSFIFEFTPTNELKYRDVFLVCTASMSAVVGVMFAHLSLSLSGGRYHAHAFPGSLLLGFVLAALLPVERRVQVEPDPVPEHSEEHRPVTALQGCNGGLLHGRSALQPGADAKNPRVRRLLLHQWKLQDGGVRILHQHQAHQRSGLCHLLPPVLLESHAGTYVMKSII